MWLRTGILAFSIFFNIVLCYRFIWGTEGLMYYRDLKQQLGSLSQQVEELNRVNLDLSNEIRLLKTDDAYVEKIIRQRLNYVKNNEILYLFEESTTEP